MKKSSATGFLSTSEDLSKRAQDLPTLPLLCRDCEAKFSGLESYFAKVVFHPFHEGQRSFTYDERLGMFALSLAWRTLKASHEALSKDAPELLEFVDRAEIAWRVFLNKSKTTTSPFESHLLFLDYVKAEEGRPSLNQWYALRGVDAQLVEGPGRIFSFTKLPWMVFVTPIAPEKMDGWQGTRIVAKGIIGSPQEVTDAEFGSYLIERSKDAMAGVLPERRRAAIMKTILRNPTRYLESESLSVGIAERDKKRLEKMKDSPDFVRALVADVIHKGVDEPLEKRAGNQLARLGSRVVADILADLPAGEAKRLDTTIRTAIQSSSINSRPSKTTTKLGTIWVAFMVHPHSAKEYQRKEIVKEVERLKDDTHGRRIPIAVFSMNVDAEGASYESAYWIPRQE